VKTSQFSLLRRRPFAALFLTQFLGAFHDNVFKNALVVLLLFLPHIEGGSVLMSTKLLTTAAAGVFIFPFVLFSALGGHLAHKYSKRDVMRWIKRVEIGIALLGLLALTSGSVPLLFLTLFSLGTHSAFFGPAKYAILPEMLEKDSLMGGNALLNTGTFLAIFLGTIVGTALVVVTWGGGLVGPALVGALLLLISIAGYGASAYIPAVRPCAPEASVRWNIVTETVRSLKFALSRSRRQTLCLLGIAWFYFMGGMFLAQIPNYTQDPIGGGPGVLTFFLVMFSLGISCGGLVNHVILKGQIRVVYVPWALLGLSVFSGDLYLASMNLPKPETLMTLAEFLSVPSHLRIVMDLGAIAVCGGLCVVPLNALLQHASAEGERAHILAASGILNALFMVGSSVFSGVLLAQGFSVPSVFLAFGGVNALCALLWFGMRGCGLQEAL